jgi:hypothetical protein
MATLSNRLNKVSPPKLGRRFGNGLKNSLFGPNAPVPVSQRVAPSGVPNTRGEANSSESRIALHAKNAGLGRCGDANNAVGAPSKEPRGDPVTETDFAELKDGTLIELVEDSKDPGRTCFAVWKDGEVRFVDRLEEDGQVFVPLPRKNEVLGCLRLPSAVKPYESMQALLCGLEALISKCVAIDKKYAPVLADFVLSTWFVDRLEVAPYLSVVGLPQSGKTTLLRVLSLVCRRPLLIADITSASFYQACARFMPTMLIDEAGSVSRNRTLRHILRFGTTRGVLAVRRNRTFHSYGAKVISWLEPPDDAALNSRCVLIPMFENESTALWRADEARVQQMAADLQAQLLRFRLENYKTVTPVAVAGDEALRPRTRDLLRALSAGHAQDAERCQGLLKFFESGEAVPPEPLSPEGNAVLRALFSAIHLSDNFACILVGDLTNTANLFLERVGEKLRLLPRKVGAVLTSLACCTRERTNSGWAIYVNRQDAEKLHQLAARYGIDGFADECLGTCLDHCSLCQTTGLNKKRADSAPPGHDLGQETLSVLNKLSSHFYRKAPKPRRETHFVLPAKEPEVKKKVLAHQGFSARKTQTKRDAGKRKLATEASAFAGGAAKRTFKK